MRTGQKSLEMIIGLVILLVVAAVVISMFLNIFQEPEVGQQAVERQQIEQQCSSLCQGWKEASEENALSAAIDYCTETFTFDANDDGSTSGRVGEGYNTYCEDGVHCFNMHSCEASFQTLDASKCREIMCEYYTEVNKDPYYGETTACQNNRGADRSCTNVHNHIGRLFSPDNDEAGVGTCGLADVTDSAGYRISNWYNDANASYDFYQQDEDQGGSWWIVCEPEYRQN